MCVCTNYVRDYGVSGYVAAVQANDLNSTCVMHHQEHEAHGACRTAGTRNGMTFTRCPHCVNPDWFVPTILEDEDLPWEVP